MASRVVKIATTLRTHKKKSIFAGVVVYYAGSWVSGWHRNNKIRSAYAAEAKVFGDQSISPESRPRRVTVLANTSANERYVWDDFTKNSLPLLHLAGLQVDIIKTESAAQLEAVAGVLSTEEADAIFVVGGEGTAACVLNGIFRAEEGRRSAALLPIAFAPGGYDNLALRRLVPLVFNEEGDIRRWCESAMALIEEKTRVLRVVECSLSGSDEKPFYGLGSVAAGWFRHIEERRRKLWYWAGLKRRFAYFWEMIKRSPSQFEVAIEYEEYCPGCSRCRPRPPVKKAEWRWWHLLTGSPRLLPSSDADRDYSGIVNEECGKIHSTLARGTELEVVGERGENEDDSTRLELRMRGASLGRVGVMREGWRRCAEGVLGQPSSAFPVSPEDVSLSGSAFSLQLRELPEIVKKVYVSGDPLAHQEEQKVTVKATNRKLHIFLPSTLRIDLANLN